MMMNSPQRSAIWLPEISQSCTRERPSPGVTNCKTGPAYSIASAKVHNATRMLTSGWSAPHSHSGAVARNHIATRNKLRLPVAFSRAITRLV